MGWATRVDFVFFTPETGKRVASAQWNPRPLFEAKLSSGRILLVNHSLALIDHATATQFDVVKGMGRLEGKKHEKNASRALVRIQDPHGVWGMAEVLISCSRPSNSPPTTTGNS
jgi:hypothetical protein